MTSRIFWLVLSLASLAAIAAQADDLESDSPEGGKTSVAGDALNESAPDVDDSEVLRLSLDESIRLALQNNLDVEVQRFTPLIAGEQETEAWGAYDPEFFAEFGYSDTEEPISFLLQGQPTFKGDSYDGFGGFRGLVPYFGSEYSFQFDGERTTTNLPVQAFSPEFRSSFSLSVSQPLLRGLIWNEAWTRVKTSRIRYDESLENFRRRVMDTVQEVEDAYWNLIATSEQKRVARKSLQTAEALLDQTKTQYEVGVVSKVEVVEAEAGVADREFNLIAAENRYRTAQDRLINLALSTELTPDSKLRIEPTDPPKEYVTYHVDAEQATQRAFEQRPELKIADDAIERQKLELKFAKNERLPGLDFQFNYGNKGLAGTPQVGGLAKGDFGDTLDDFLTSDAADQISARAVLTIPLTNTAARSRVSQTELALRRTTVEKRRLQQDIILEVRKAVRDLESSQEGIEAAQRAAEASAEQLRAERIRLEYGESTPFDVLLREEDFVTAESREIEAIRLYRTSVTGLSRAQGSILANRNIAIDQISSVQ
ncbi:MAG: TolC family protein [Deltaproteobacteria bacterium]|nr:TolC family protein [Deltaproteobacteria bacterium]